MDMEIGFPGGVAVTASYKGHLVTTDQPEAAGGEDRAPAPFDLFLASIGTCAGLYALRFCQQRGIDTTGLAVRLRPVRDEAAHRIARLEIGVELPPGFPARYREAIRRAIDQCAVKRHIVEPPEFVVAVA
jgi:ribosomal protein S12 methylthiotransferase accessory factor